MTNEIEIQANKTITRLEFEELSSVPPENEWFANIINKNTRRAYKKDVLELFKFLGLDSSDELRDVNRAHIIAWRRYLSDRELAAATIRRKLASVSALYQYLCEKNAVLDNPVHGVSRPNEGSNEGNTPALGVEQVRRLLDSPDDTTLKGRRDKAILAVLVYHALRREELCSIKVGDRHTREGMNHFRIRGKGSKLRFVPVHPKANRLIDEYRADIGGEDPDEPLFIRVRGDLSKIRSIHMSPDSIYAIVKEYGLKTGLDLELNGLSPHMMRATAATNALSNHSDITEVQTWLGHSSIATTKKYDRRESKPEDSPTFKLKY